MNGDFLFRRGKHSYPHFHIDPLRPFRHFRHKSLLGLPGGLMTILNYTTVQDSSVNAVNPAFLDEKDCIFGYLL
jgi:hypothetical protein